MMDNDSMDDTSMDLDLNQEPSDPSVRSVTGLGSLLSELETAHGQIEQRIRQLEAVTARARQRQRWRQARNPPETRNALIESIGNINSYGTSQNVEDGGEGTVERAKSYKRDRTHLVAEALRQNNMAKRVIENEGGGYFDCNICLDTAKEPILTCCGHLFCWSCFYQLPYVYSTAKECPVCKGEVMDRNVTPIYGNGTHVSELQPEAGLKVPPRPKAHRVEGVRQQHIDRVFSHIPVAEALRRIRREIGAMEGQRRRLDPNSRPDRSNFPGDIFPDFSIALPRNEIQEDIAAIRNDFSRESRQRVLSLGREDVADNSSAAPLASSFETMRVSAHNLALQNLRHLPDTETSLTEPRTMRRIRFSILSEVENEVAREQRRRRLS
ncbi:Ubiquitin--protein ligase [Bertholletia excelsa]